MKPLSYFSCLALAAALLLGAGGARADVANFTYSWSTVPSPPVFPSGTGSVALALAPDGSGVCSACTCTCRPARTRALMSALPGTFGAGTLLKVGSMVTE